MRRRKVLALGGIALTSALAGCGGNGTDSDDDSGNGADPTPEPDPEPEDSDSDATDEPEPDAEDGPARSDADTLLSIQEIDSLFADGGQTITGSGQQVIPDGELNAALTTVVFEHNGDRNFVVELEGPTDDLLVNEIGPTDGATAVPTEAGEYIIDVDADDEWSLTIAQPRAPDDEIRTPPVTASGEGHDVVGPVAIDGTVTITGEHDGERNFIVNGYDQDAAGAFAGELVFNELGVFEGATRADPRGVVWFDVDADGSWQLAIEE